VGIRLPADHRLEVDYRGLDLREWDFINDLVNGVGRATVRQDDLGARLAGRWGEVRYDRVWSHKDYSNEKSEYVPDRPGYVPIFNELVNGYPAYDDYHYAQAGFDDGADNVRAQASQGIGTHFLSLGGELTRSWSRSNLWSNNGVYVDDSTWQKVTTYNRAAFAEDQWSLTRAWTVTAGGRVDDHSQAGVNASPRLAVNYAQGADQFWRVSYSSGYRLPTDIETHLRQYYFRSDEDLRAEKLHEVDLGWSRRLGNDARLSVNGFYSYGKDLIWLKPLPEDEMAANWNTWLASGPNPTKQPGPFFTYANQSIPAETTGVDVSGDCRLDGTPVTMFANGTWQRMRYRESIVYRSDGFVDPLSGSTMFRFNEDLGRDINAPPEWKANLGARAEYGHLFGALVGRWVDSRRVLSFAYSYFPIGTVYTQKVPSYATLDASVGWDFEGNAKYRRFVRLSVLDLLDRSHYETYEASSDQMRIDYNRQYSSEIGRAVTVQVGLIW
jgi:outer membrane receptor for ferrienterochelin and colicin